MNIAIMITVITLLTITVIDRLKRKRSLLRNMIYEDARGRNR